MPKRSFDVSVAAYAWQITTPKAYVVHKIVLADKDEGEKSGPAPKTHLKFTGNVGESDTTRTLREQRAVQDQRRLAEAVERSTCWLELEFLAQHVGSCHHDNGQGRNGDDASPQVGWKWAEELIQTGTSSHPWHHKVVAKKAKKKCH